MYIVKLTEYLKKTKSNEKMLSLFIDFKSAYNTINKKKLFEILKRLEIYEDDEL
jgi:hypothetical protein